MDTEQQKIINAEEYDGEAAEQAYGFFLFNNKGKFLSSNTVGSIMLGYSKEEFMELNIADIFPAIPELSDDNPVHVKKELLRKDGSLLYAEISAQASADGIEIVIRADQGQL